MFTLALAAVVLLALALDLRAARGDPGGRASALALAALIAAVIAALVPLGALLPHPSLAHVASVPSFDAMRPCVPPAEPPSRLHGVAPLAVLHVLFPIIVAAALGATTRPIVRPRRALAVAFAFALLVLVVGGARALRGGVDVASIRACGALTPEEGADAARVRSVIDRMVGDRQLSVIRWRELPKLPRPPWVRSEIPVTIRGEPWVLRVRGDAVIAEPDDLRRADRPLPALHFASVPVLAQSAVTSVLLDPRPDGRLYAVRVGRAVQAHEIGPLLRPPLWPIAAIALALVVSAIALYVARARNALAPSVAPYRTAPTEQAVLLAEATPAIVTLLLIEVTGTAWHALAPYL